MYEEDEAESDLNLTPEELEILRSEGMLPNDWEPGQPSKEDLTLPNGPIQSPQEGDVSMPSGPLSQPQPGDISSVPGLPSPLTTVSPVQQGKELLGQMTMAATPAMNPMAQKFHDLAVSWLPTNDDDLKVARTNAQKAADELAALRAAAQTKAGQFPMNEFGAALLAGGYGSFPQRYGQALMSAQEVQRHNLATAQKLGLDEAEGTARQALGQEASVYKRMDAAAAMERAAATMQRYGGPTKTAATSEIGRAVSALGYDLNTPEGQIAGRRMWMMQHGTPEIKEAIGMTPDSMNPDSPEFKAAVAEVFKRQLGKKELEEQKTQQQIAASQQSVAASRAQEAEAKVKARKVEQDIETGKTELMPDPVAAKQVGVPMVTINPYKGLSSQAQAAHYALEQKSVTKELEGITKQQEASSKVVQGAMQMDELLKGGLKTGTQYLGPLGAQKYFPGEAGEKLRRFDQIAKEITPNYRAIGSGSTSDYEQRLYAAAAPGLDKPVAVNQAAINGIMITDRLSKMKQEALEKYFAVNKTGSGFMTYWNQYLNDTFFDAQGNVHFPKTRTGFDDFTTWSKKKFHSGEAQRAGSKGADPLGVR